MILRADLHTHTIASGHAYGTIRENIQGAKEAGIDLLGVTEHAPGVPNTCDPFYFQNIQVIPREINGVSLLIGSEINVKDDGTLSMEQKYIDKLDFAIVGIHMVCYRDAGKEKNTDNLIACMQNSKVCFVSHPDDDHTPLDYERFVKAAKEFHVAPEVNNSSLLKPDRRLNCFENYRTMLGFCKKHDVPIIISSDAHDPSGVGRLEPAIRLVEECGFPEELVLTTSREKALEFIYGR